MRLFAENISKKFDNNILFKNLTCSFYQGHKYGVIGANGTGKSTLLQILSGYISPTLGKVCFENEEVLDSSEINYYKNISFAAPYLELIDDYSIQELIRYHFRFDPMLPDFDMPDVLENSALAQKQNIPIRNLSSGMKQRVKLLLAFASNKPVLLLDEPCTNLDKEGIDWYKMMVKNCTEKKF